MKTALSIIAAAAFSLTAITAANAADEDFASEGRILFPQGIWTGR